MAGRRARRIRNAAPKGPRRDPFAATPDVFDEVEQREDSEGRVQLRREFASPTRLGRFLARRFGWRRVARVNLDEQGSAFWRLVDGRRTLKEIERTLRGELDLEERKSREATILFTKMLMARNLIYLKIPKDKEARAARQDAAAS